MKSWYGKKWITVVVHLVAWLLLFSSPYLLQPGQQTESSGNSDDHHFALSIITNLSWVIFFYLNALVLIPRFVYKKKYWLYALLLAIIFCWLLAQTTMLYRLFYEQQEYDPRLHLFFIAFVYLLILASSTAYRMVIDRIKNERRAKEMENTTLKTELAFLRSQVSPHFMFNVLNNMVALARKRSEDLEPSLIKLSSLLRYMLYETAEERVLLQKEIEYIRSYIDLQTQRFGSKVRINVVLNEPDQDYYIEPMLLIPFVENAFKHGTGLIADPEINIYLEAKEKQLVFKVSNRYNRSVNEEKDKTSGIGLQNVNRRLDLLYRNNHTLTINDEQNRFTILLQINFHS